MMDYTNYAADGSPADEGVPSSPSSMSTGDICGPVRSHNRSFRHPTLQVNLLLPFQQTQPQPHIPVPSSSFSSSQPRCSQSQMTQPPSADESATSGGTSPPLGDDQHILSRSLHHLTPHQDSIMSDYWHTSPFLTDPLHTPDPDTDVNHSERGIAGFVSKLYQSLQAPDDGQKYARWCKHDDKDMFIIECIPKFTEVVLPRLFKHCKFASFVRQLNIYGFRRDTDARKTKDTKDKESCRWYHPYFRPGRRDLFHLIRRKAARYRRKRSRLADDPETIINVGSGDESENDELQQTQLEQPPSAPEQPQDAELDDRPRSASISSVQPDAFQSRPYTLMYDDCVQPSHTPSSADAVAAAAVAAAAAAAAAAGGTTVPMQPMVPEAPQQHTPSQSHSHLHQRPHPHPHSHSHSHPHQQQQQHPSQPQPQTQQEQQQQQQQQQPQATHSRPEPSDARADSFSDPLADWISPHTQVLDHRQVMLREQDLRAQILHLKQAYQNMSKIFDAQIKGAYELIDAQSRRIQMLEAAKGQDPANSFMPNYVETSYMQLPHHQAQQHQHTPQQQHQQAHPGVRGDAYTQFLRAKAAGHLYPGQPSSSKMNDPSYVMMHAQQQQQQQQQQRDAYHHLLFSPAAVENDPVTSGGTTGHPSATVAAAAAAAVAATSNIKVEHPDLGHRIKDDPSERWFFAARSYPEMPVDNNTMPTEVALQQRPNEIAYGLTGPAAGRYHPGRIM